MWMYGLWCFRPKAILIGILGVVTLMAIPNQNLMTLILRRHSGSRA